MSFIRRLIAVFVICFSGAAFADNYPASVVFTWTQWGVTYTYTNAQSAANQSITVGGCSSASLPAIIDSQTSTVLYFHASFANGNCTTAINSMTLPVTLTCPAGGTVSGANCINAPACVAPQVRNTSTKLCWSPPVCLKYQTLNNSTGTCVNPVCTSPQVNSTVTGGCIPPPGLVGIDCYNGKTVYVPSVCPVNPIDAIRADITPPNPGEIKICKDGSQVTYPQSCFSKYTMDLAFQLMTSGSSKIAAKISDLIMTKGANGEYQLTTNWAAKLKDITSYSRDVTEIPRGVVADSVTAYSNAGKGFNVLADIVSRSSGDLTLTNNQIFPVGSSTALTPNQILSAMEQYGSSLPPSVDMAPYIPLHEVLGLESSFVKLSRDWEAIQDGNPATVPELLPPTSIGTTPQFAVSPAPVDWPAVQTDPMPHYWPAAVSPSPVPASAPQSPNTFVSLDPVTGQSMPQPTATSPYTVAPPGEQPVTVPTLENDKQPYFPWMLKTETMNWNAINFFPVLPVSGSCVYVIDYTFHVPMLGNKSIHIAPCDKLATLRAILGWFFAVLTMFTIFFIIFRSTAHL